MIAFFIGLLYTVPAVMIANYAAFAHITQLNKEDEEEKGNLLDHLIEG